MYGPIQVDQIVIDDVVVVVGSVATVRYGGHGED